MVFGSRKRRQPTVHAPTKKMKTRLQKLKPVLGVAGAVALGAIALKFGGGSIKELLSYAEAYGMRKALEKLLAKNKEHGDATKITNADIESVTKYFAADVEYIITSGAATQYKDVYNTGITKSAQNFIDYLLKAGAEKVHKCTMEELVLGFPITSKDKIVNEFRWTNKSGFANNIFNNMSRPEKEIRIFLQLFRNRVGKFNGFSISVRGDAALSPRRKVRFEV